MLIRRQSKKAESVPAQPAQTTPETGNTNRTYQFDENEIVLNPSQIHQGGQDFYDINLSDHEEKAANSRQLDQEAQETTRGAHSNYHVNGSYQHDENIVVTFWIKYLSCFSLLQILGGPGDKDNRVGPRMESNLIYFSIKKVS